MPTNPILRRHPEKSLFEWPLPSYEVINHTFTAVVANHFPAASFARFAASNRRTFATAAEEAAALIYSFPVTDARAFSSDFDELYAFPASQ